jgi:hypothetical protein
MQQETRWGHSSIRDIQIAGGIRSGLCGRECHSRHRGRGSVVAGPSDHGRRGRRLDSLRLRQGPPGSALTTSLNGGGVSQVMRRINSRRSSAVRGRPGGWRKWHSRTGHVNVEPLQEGDGRPARSGAKGDAPDAQKAAQRVDATNGDESQGMPEVIGECESTRLADSRNILMPNDLRECMGIEPTESFVQTPRWF